MSESDSVTWDEIYYVALRIGEINNSAYNSGSERVKEINDLLHEKKVRSIMDRFQQELLRTRGYYHWRYYWDIKDGKRPTFDELNNKEEKNDI